MNGRFRVLEARRLSGKQLRPSPAAGNVVMSSPAESSPAQLIADVDQRIIAARTYLRVVRTLFRNCPTGEGVTACETGEAKLNELLERRFALTSEAGSACTVRTTGGDLCEPAGTG